ncbi:MAG: DHH family phosphoesterase, partial [Salinibacterium sp.]|nr:DHH family phosphoesterase [Salinibacterium sp.]
MSAQDTATWTTTTNAEKLAEWLKGASSITLLTHTKPDGDAAGSTLGLARALRIAGVDATCWYAGALPLWLEGLACDTPFKHVDEDGLPGESDLGVICDTGSWSQLEPVRGWLQGRADKLAIVDHHLHGDGEITERRWISTESAAVCQPVASLCAHILGKSAISELPVEVASPLYFGIGTDTGWFRHSNVNAQVLDDAADLLRAGVEHVKLYSLSEQRDRPSRLKLMAIALSSARFIAADRAVIMGIGLADLNSTKALASETGGIVDQAMSIESIRVGALLTEVRDSNHSDGPVTKMSLRSKELGEASIDVNMLAQRFGGGGHADAGLFLVGERGLDLGEPLAQRFGGGSF